MDHHHRERIVLLEENNLLREERRALVQATTFPSTCGSCNANIIPTDLVAEANRLQLENDLLRSQIETLTCFAKMFPSSISQLPSVAPSSSTKLCVVEVMTALSFDEVVSLARYETPMWTDDERLNLNEYYSRFFPWYARNVLGFVHEVSRASALVSSNAFQLVTNLMDPGRWPRIFPSIIANMSMESQDHGFQVINMDFMPLVSSSYRNRKVKLLRFCDNIENNTWVIADISMYFTSYTANSRPTFMRFPSGYIVKHVANHVCEVTALDHWVYGQSECINPYPNFGFGAQRWLDALQRHCYNDCVTWDPSIGHHIQTYDPVRSTNLLNLSTLMVYQFCTGVCGITRINWRRLNMDCFPNNDVIMFTRESQDPNGNPCVFVSATSVASMRAKPEDVFRLIKRAKKKDIWNGFDPSDHMTEVIRIKRGCTSKNEVCVFKLEGFYIIQETYYEATSAMIIHGLFDAATFEAALNDGHAPNLEVLPFGLVIMPYGLEGCIVSAGFQTVVLQTADLNAGQHVIFTVRKRVCDTLRNVENVVGVSSNLP